MRGVLRVEWNDLLSTDRFCKKRRFEGMGYFDKYKTTEFESDYQTIINSASFRRLQDKTQVFPLDKSDFVRTRLTHSLETSSIAKQLGSMILDNMKNEVKKSEEDESGCMKRCCIDYNNYKDILDNIPEILSCAGLLHDIGNPPFGHFGETVMADWFKENLKSIKFKDKKIDSILTDLQIQDFYHLEGNAQALRVMCRLHIVDNDYGMNLTKSLINVLVKYPVCSLKVDEDSHNIFYHKLGFYDCDHDLFDNISSTTGTKLNENEYVRHPLTFLLEAADDIAYSTADIEDAFKKGFFTLEEFISVYRSLLDEDDIKYKHKAFKMLENLENIKIDFEKEPHNEQLLKMQMWLNEIRQWFMYNAAYSFIKNYDDIMEGTYTQELMDDVFHTKTLKILKKIAKKLIFNDSSITKIEISGSGILSFLLDKFIGAIIHYDIKDENYTLSKEDIKLIGLLPDNYKENYKMEKKKYTEEKDFLYLRIHLVVDYISGMTDSYARRLYQELHGGY